MFPCGCRFLRPCCWRLQLEQLKSHRQMHLALYRNNSVIFLVKLNRADSKCEAKQEQTGAKTCRANVCCSSVLGGNSKPNGVLGASETLFPRRRSADALRAFYEHKRDCRVHNPRFAGLLEIESIPSKCLCYTSASRILLYSNFRNNA
jgi:hypothetical protein